MVKDFIGKLDWKKMPDYCKQLKEEKKRWREMSKKKSKEV